MSHNTEPERSAPRHVPALVAIGVALACALMAFLFAPGLGGQEAGMASTPPPATAAGPDGPVPGGAPD